MVKANPCKGGSAIQRSASIRYITDDEYNALYSVAPTVVKVAMELAYLCCARRGDVLGLTKAALCFRLAQKVCGRIPKPHLFDGQLCAKGGR